MRPGLYMDITWFFSAEKIGMKTNKWVNLGELKPSE